MYRPLGPLLLRVALVAVGACAGTIGEPGDDDDCDPSLDSAPATPSLVEPAPDRIDVIPAQMVLSGSAFSDADPGDAHARSQFEVWTLVGGVLTARVWSASIDDPARLTRVTLADGQFEGIALPGGLAEWQDYAARVRYRDVGASCSAWSEWSPPLPFRTDDGSSYLFDPGQVRTLYLDIPPQSWDAINAEAIPPGCVNFRRNYYRGTLRFEEQTFADVGVRIKGGCGSSRDLGGKASFKVNLEWDDPAVPGCPSERRLGGQKSLTLNNGVQDRSWEHERLSYALYLAMGVPAPRSAHVRLYVNDQYWGLYLDVETPGRRFLSRWFDHNEGMMYEGAYWCDLLPANVPTALEADACFTREFSADLCTQADPGADPTDWELLRQLSQQIEALPADGFYPEVTSFLDFDTFLSMWAVEVMIAHWDGYAFNLINNYRVYHDPASGRWTMIPWGTDQTFLGDLDPWESPALLVTRCLGEADCAAAFAERLRLASTRFEGLGMAAQAQSIHALIAPDVADDPRKEYDVGTWEAAHAELLGWIAQRPGRVREILANRGF